MAGIANKQFQINSSRVLRSCFPLLRFASVADDNGSQKASDKRKHKLAAGQLVEWNKHNDFASPLVACLAQTAWPLVDLSLSLFFVCLSAFLPKSIVSSCSRQASG